MAKIKAIRHSRTKNLGNYESARSEVEIDFEPGDTLPGVLNMARALVALDLGEIDGPAARDTVQKLVEGKEISDRGIGEQGVL